MTLVLKPNGWPCLLAECKPGPFLCDGELCFKAEHQTSGQIDVFNSTGERLWAGKGSFAEIGNIIVQSVVMEKEAA